MAAPDAHIFGNLINHDVDLNVDAEARRNLINQFARQHDVDLNVDDEAYRNLINQFARQHDLNYQALRNLGLLLVFIGASIILGATPQQRSLSLVVNAIPRAAASEDIFMAFTAFVLGVLLILLSLVVHVIPRAAAFVDAVLNRSFVVVNAICLIDL